MTFQELLNDVYTAFRGKIASKTPVFGSDKANVVLAIANRLQRQWANDTNQHWSSLFEIKTVDTIDISTFTYNLDTTFITPSGCLVITKTDGTDTEIELTKPQKRTDNTTKAYISGNNPKKVTFTAIDAGFDDGILKAPGYYMPTDMVNSTDLVVVDNPEWLVYATAAELARNDSAKQDQFPNLLGTANDLYEKMIAANNDLGFGQDNTIPNNMPQIGDQAEEEAFI